MSDKFNYTEFFDEVEQSLTIHSHDLDRKIYEAPNTHNKILRRYTIEKNKLHRLESKRNKVFGEKYHFYRHQYEFKIENKDVAIFYIEKDPEYIEVNEEYQKQKLLLDIIEKWMKKASSIAFDIKNIVEFIKFMGGN